VIDSGCANYITGEGSMFECLKESDGDRYITFAGNQKGKVLPVTLIETQNSLFQRFF
jgi:hypothetical protein